MKKLIYDYENNLVDNKDLKSLLDTLLGPGELSTLIMESQPTYNKPENPEHNLYYLNTFIKAIKLIDTLGNIEHSSDWDPYLEVTLADGDTFTTTQGYYLVEIQPNNRVYIQDENQESTPFYDFSYMLHIDEIVSITIKR